MSSKEEKRSKKEKKDKKSKKHRRDEEVAHSSSANPWGDSNSNGQFVWKLKKDRDIAEGREAQDHSNRRQDEILLEIEKVKRRRHERELEKQRWEEERSRMQRDKDMNEAVEWEKKDNEFFLNQARVRSEIRIREGRPKPIDIIYKNLNKDSNFKIEMKEPHLIFKGLPLPELEELQREISMYQELDSKDHSEFWQALMIVCHYRIEKAKARPQDQDAVHKAVNQEINMMFKGKSFDELSTLEAGIREKLTDDSVDMEYWESLLKRLVIHKAKAKLREIHAQLVVDFEKDSSNNNNNNNNNASNSNNNNNATSSSTRRTTEIETVYAYSDEETVDDSATLRKKQLEREAERLRSRTSGSSSSSSSSSNRDEKLMTEEEMYARELMVGMDESEESFTTEFPIESKKYNWDDKFRPRKPKYFNRVHTGFEWNKYNQTHYDHDNPPPKVVQGYKFNIFYPDLLDPSKAPQYFITPSPDSPDYVILRFHAGAPYEDIAFTIVNKEWEYSHRKGFKCTFERGILHLWFNFKRYRYRR